MINYTKRVVKTLTSKPKTVFLIDGLGAVLTAIILMAVLRHFNDYFGMPREALAILSIAALIFAVYSFSCFVFLDNNAQKLLRPIIVANLTYCVLTLSLVLYFYNRLTILGIAYFVGEVLIICGIVYMELKTLKANSQNIS